jgi:phosphatidylserine decarboxylase
LAPVLKDFKEFIESTPRVYMYFNAMFDEVPMKRPYNKDPTGLKQIRDYHHMLEVLNHTFTTAPHWTDAAANVGMVGVPMCAIFDYPMGTASGYAAFLDPEVNAHLKKILNEWGKFLCTPKSAEVLGEHNQGWFGPTGKKDIMQVANAPYKTSHDFPDFFECDANAKHYGFKSCK